MLMAITNTQRELALCGILQASLLQVPSLTPNLQLGSILPNTTGQQALAGLVTIIGTQFDASLTTACANMLASIQTVNLAQANAAITALTIT
jgi:hypothetical protein